MDGLTPAEVSALRALGTKTWKLNELPAGVTDEALEGLDVLGLVECLDHGTGSTTNLHGKKVTYRTPSPFWLSPVKDKGQISSWERLFKRARAKPEEAAEVRLNAKGKRELGAADARLAEVIKELREKSTRDSREAIDRRDRKSAEALRAMLAQPLEPRDAVQQLRAMSALAAVRPHDTYDGAAAIVTRMSRLGVFKAFPLTHQVLCANDGRPVGSSLVGWWADFSSSIRKDKGMPPKVFFESFAEDTQLAADLIEAFVKGEPAIAGGAEPSDLSPLAETLWRYLKGRCGGTADDLASSKILNSSAETVRGLVVEIRAKRGRKAVGNKRGYGYFRSDAPPDWSIAKPKRKRRVTAA
jgi:hypothetical protein